MNSLPPRDTDVLVIYLVRLGGYVALAHAEAQAAPRVATGGTLFERMAGLTRGADKGAGASDDGTPTPDIPRFLNRQSNQ